MGKGYFYEDVKINQFTICIYIVATSIYGVTVGLQLLVFILGLKEIISAKEKYDNQQKKLAFASLGVGVFACVCVFFSITNII